MTAFWLLTVLVSACAAVGRPQHNWVCHHEILAKGAKSKPLAGRGGLPVSDNFLEIAPIAVCAAGSGV